MPSNDDHTGNHVTEQDWGAGLTAPQDCSSMDEVREQIDQIDTQMVHLLATRWGYVDRAWQLKATPDQAVVPWRIQQVIDRVRDKAQAAGAPPELAEALWRQIIGWGIQYEQEKLQAVSDQDG